MAAPSVTGVADGVVARGGEEGRDGALKARRCGRAVVAGRVAARPPRRPRRRGGAQEDPTTQRQLMGEGGAAPLKAAHKPPAPLAPRNVGVVSRVCAYAIAAPGVLIITARVPERPAAPGRASKTVVAPPAMQEPSDKARHPPLVARPPVAGPTFHLPVPRPRGGVAGPETAPTLAIAKAGPASGGGVGWLLAPSARDKRVPHRGLAGPTPSFGPSGVGVAITAYATGGIVLAV